jgi:hypothetical protein
MCALLLLLALAQDPDVAKLVSADENERETAVDALVRAGDRERVAKAVGSAEGDLKKRLEAVLAAIDVSVRAKKAAAEELKIDVARLRELRPETAARFFGNLRFFWIHDETPPARGGLVVDGAGKVSRVSHGCPELVSLVEGRSLDLKSRSRTEGVLRLLYEVWFGPRAGGDVHVGAKCSTLNAGDFAISLTTDDAGRITKAAFVIW